MARPPCQCTERIEKVVARNDGELLDWLTELRNSTGWCYFARIAWNKALETKRRWDREIKPEELSTRNFEVAKAQAVLDLIQLLDQDIAALQEREQKGA